MRGLVGNRVLILVDGVRLNNGIYRLDPKQYLNTIDIHQIERIEVVRDPGSVLYGSDAPGGVINIITYGRNTVALENLGDRTYRLYGSGIDAPGFNAVVGYELTL